MMNTGLTDDELIERVKKERELIVQRYDIGREKGAIIDPWEDPDFEIYHTTDRYGFIHDVRLPSQRTKEEKIKLDLEVSRTSKWEKMLLFWNKYSGTSKLASRIYKGIPLRFRSEIWSRLLNIKLVKEQQKGIYEEMKRLGRKWSPDARQIDLDVNRTYRDHVIFRKRYDVKQQELFHILVAYSLYNQEIGYCQGMSQIAALLLMFLTEEDAFWGLSELMANKKYAMHGFFIPGFPKLLRFQNHHDKILQKFLPRLKIHLDRNCIDSGERLLVAMSYTILKLHRRQISRLDMDQILDYLQKRLEKDFGHDDDYVIQSLQKSMEELKKSKLNTPGPPPDQELPQLPFGMFVEPSEEAETGRRRELTDEERKITESLIERQDGVFNGAFLSVDHGSRQSLDQSVDEVSSLGEVCGSNISLANTSLTSAPDVSTLSSLTLSRIKHNDGTSTQSDHSESQSVQSIRSPHSPERFELPTSDSECRPVNGCSSPSFNPSIVRTLNLSASQTTLIEPGHHSETVTPTAGEMPEAVRIYVPYPDNTAYGYFENKLMHNDSPGQVAASIGDPNVIRIHVDGDNFTVSQAAEDFSGTHSFEKYKTSLTCPVDLDSPELQEDLL